MSNTGNKIWVNVETGKPHGGDQQERDREATAEELAAIKIKELRNKALDDYNQKGDLLLRSLKLAELRGIESSVVSIKATLLKIEKDFVDAINEINAGGDPWAEGKSPF